MINRIDFIKDFGIFKNFSWNSVPDIESFKEKNIIYGWNYSGKTTLSRLFSSLRDKVIHKNYKKATFKITTDVGQFDTSTLATFPYEIEVFNAEYSKENLRWEYDENINAIFFEVGDNARISKEIERINILIDSINGTDVIKSKKNKFQSAIDEYSQFENELYTQEAGKIKNNSFASLIEFNKGHLKKIKENIISSVDSHIIKTKDEISLLSKIIKIESPKPKIDPTTFNSEYSRIVKLTIEALNSVPSKSDVIEILDKKKEAYDWVKDGLKLHNKNDSCLFCGNDINTTRYEKLNRYFENQASKLKENVFMIFKLINNEEHLINTLNMPSSINDFNDGFQDEYKKLKNDTDKEIKKYKLLLKNIQATLTKKINGSIYSVMPSSYVDSDVDNLVGKITSINNVIIENNKFVDDFETIIEGKRLKYKNHLVASFIKQSKYLSKKTKYEKSIIELQKLETKVKEFQKQVLRLNSQKESDAEGCLQFNSFVQSFLSRDDIKIVLNTDTKKFNLMRGDDLAQNLSEGEKMAISFSHFLVNLKSIEQKGELSNYIIYIDDPISSLDSNHIFQINSLLKDIFFDNIPDPSNPKQSMWTLKCRQIFISTHNFEFFTLLKELPKKGYKKDSRYFISRKLTESSIEKLPNVYNTYSSEYHYLFGEILRFNNEVDKSASNKLLLIPNILRRFVEMYTLTKCPSNEEVDPRAEKVFGKRESKRILKLLHHFSHFNSIDRIHKHSEFVADIEHACNDLITHIRTKDLMHYSALEASIN